MLTDMRVYTIYPRRPRYTYDRPALLQRLSVINTLYMHITCMYEAYKDAALSLVHRLIYNTHPPE